MIAQVKDRVWSHPRGHPDPSAVAGELERLVQRSDSDELDSAWKVVEGVLSWLGDCPTWREPAGWACRTRSGFPGEAHVPRRRSAAAEVDRDAPIEASLDLAIEYAADMRNRFHDAIDPHWAVEQAVAEEMARHRLEDRARS